ncbi:MAG: hypothetical protein MUE40_05695 [Anaerolineae bacterium]|jgi:outer membrane biosynthesis protein TonB|nr:hypothetical protein [Anaerolineae bacterium]
MPENETEIKVNVTVEADDEAAGTPMERFFYHQRRALEETAKALDALLPPGFKEHATEASREFAKGFRVLVDATIDELKKISEKEEEPEVVEAEVEEPAEEPKPEEPRQPTTGKTKVKVKLD